MDRFNQNGAFSPYGDEDNAYENSLLEEIPVNACKNTWVEAWLEGKKSLEIDAATISMEEF